MYKVLDCTLRDGGHSTNWCFSDDFVTNSIKFAIQNNIEYFEIGYRNNLEKENKGRFFYCTKELIQKFLPEKGAIKIGVMTDTSRFNFNDFNCASQDCLDFIRIATHPDKIEQTLDIAQILHSRGYKIFVQLMEIPNLNKNHYEILEKWSNKNIIESLYIADTYSTVKPEDIPQFYEKLRLIGYNKISFHAHNEKGLALQNTIRAIELGAFSVDISQNGLGGNLDAQKFFK